MSNAINEKLYQWYIVTTVAGKEDIVINNLWGKIRSYNYEDYVKDIRVIKEKIVEIKSFNIDNAPSIMRETAKIKWETILNDDGSVAEYRKTRTEEKNKFSGYIFVKMYINDELWFIIRNTESVTGLVGSSGKNSKPIPVGSYEIERILNSDKYDSIDDLSSMGVTKIEKTKNDIILQKEYYECDFEVGSQVKIISGSMENQEGIVTSLNHQKGVATIEIDLFGQIQEMTVDFNQIEEIK
ncbi:MAG: transcription termination/antitermination protein NusG [Ureaplasma sp.]|nr:transcription termination/antitermination protein NusG [Ureaplasma sp.]